MFVPVGDNPVRLFALDARTRALRLATNAGLVPAEALPAAGPAIVADLDYSWDPAWLRALAARPDSALMLDERAVLAHVTDPALAARVAATMAAGEAWTGDALERLDPATTRIGYDELRKRERPFVMALDETSADAAERAAYDASYKGVTDLLTLYLWRRPAFHLTRWAAAAGIPPNLVTAVGALLCVVAFLLFWEGDFWLGIAAGFVFMVLDTVDGKLARCTGTSSRWGDVFDHGIDLVHPPFWWWAWGEGLIPYGRPLEPVLLTCVVGIIFAGYVLQRVIEGMFIHRFAMHIHVWRPVDSRFRLVTARRNPNMVILVAALIAGRPDVGLEMVALWTLVSLIFHAVRLAQANARADRGRKIISWLS